MKRIIISGGNEGIGYYMTKQFLDQGFMVAVLDIKANNLEELKEIYQDLLLFHICDISDEKATNIAINKIMTILGNIDYVIHNACKCIFKDFNSVTLEEIKEVFNVNYFGCINMSKAILPYMLKQNRGKIFFTSSGVGVTGFYGISGYASSKGAIESLAKCLNIEYKDADISFHILHPPLTRTTSASPLPVPDQFKADPEKVGRGLAKNIDINKFFICHSSPQRLQTRMAYRFPFFLGKFLSKMSKNQK